MARLFFVAAALTLCLTDVAQAQVETLVVTASRVPGYSPYNNVEAVPAVPHIYLLKRADHVITKVKVTCDTREYRQRVGELKATLRNMIKAAAATPTLSLSVGETVITDLKEESFDEIISADERPDTSYAIVIIKTKIDANDTLRGAQARITKFINDTREDGRTEVLREGDWNLTIVGPEQYRDGVIKLIVDDAKHTSELFGAGNTFDVEGLEHPISWYQKGPLDLGLYIPYTLKIVPSPH